MYSYIYIYVIIASAFLNGTIWKYSSAVGKWVSFDLDPWLGSERYKEKLATRIWVLIYYTKYSAGKRGHDKKHGTKEVQTM